MRTFEVVLRLRVVRAHDGRGLPPDHDQHPHAALGLPLQQLAQRQPGQVKLQLRLQQRPVVASGGRKTRRNLMSNRSHE